MLEKYRLDIDEIDDEMLKLFIKRMDKVSEIAKYKKANNIPILNIKRENEHKNRLISQISPKYKLIYNDFIDNTMKISRNFQENLNNEA